MGETSPWEACTLPGSAPLNLTGSESSNEWGNQSCQVRDLLLPEYKRSIKRSPPYFSGGKTKTEYFTFISDEMSQAAADHSTESLIDVSLVMGL